MIWMEPLIHSDQDMFIAFHRKGRAGWKARNEWWKVQSCVMDCMEE